MKNFRIQIRCYGYYADFKILCKDTPQDIENSILDKLGEKSIKWESTGMFRDPRRITYEEVSNDRRPRQTKEVLGVRVAV